MKTKLFIFATISVILSACNKNEPTKAFEGVWEPFLCEECVIPDLFVITSDSIKAIQCDTKEEHYQCHYKVLRDSIVELERCWIIEELESMQRPYNPSDYISEEYMYVDNEGFLIIRKFWMGNEISQIYPNYTQLKLRRYEDK